MVHETFNNLLTVTQSGRKTNHSFSLLPSSLCYFFQFLFFFSSISSFLSSLYHIYFFSLPVSHINTLTRLLLFLFSVLFIYSIICLFLFSFLLSRIYFSPWHFCFFFFLISPPPNSSFLLSSTWLFILLLSLPSTFPRFSFKS